MHATQRFMSVGQAAFGANAVFEMQCHLQQASITPAPHPSVFMQTQGEMRNESQPHAHANRQEGMGKEGKSEWEKEKRRAAREEEEYKTG